MAFSTSEGSVAILMAMLNALYTLLLVVMGLYAMTVHLTQVLDHPARECRRHCILSAVVCLIYSALALIQVLHLSLCEGKSMGESYSSTDLVSNSTV